MSRPKLIPITQTVPYLLVLLAFFMPAVLLLFARGFYVNDVFTGDYLFRFFTHSADVLTKTLMLGFAVTMLCIVIAYPLAYFISTSKKYGGVLIALTISPLLVSTVIQSFGWTIIFGNNGIVNNALLALHLVNSPVQLLFSLTGIAIGLTQTLLPFMVLSLASALFTIDRRLNEAAENLGAGRVRVFLTVTLPLSMPGILAGSALVFAACFSVFVVPSLLGGAQFVMSTFLVYHILTLDDWVTGAIISLIMFVTVILIIFLFQSLANRSRYRGVFR